MFKFIVTLACLVIIFGGLPVLIGGTVGMFLLFEFLKAYWVWLVLGVVLYAARKTIEQHPELMAWFDGKEEE